MADATPPVAPRSDRPRVCVIYTGGTIGMVDSDHGLVPHPGFLEGYLAQMPELQHDSMPEHDLVIGDPLLDSADMDPQDWVRIAGAIIKRYEDYDGFVVLHGTDTMAYSASALSFLLQGLGKPVVCTGAQLSLQEVRSDGREHVITAILLAGTSRIPEVGVYFGSRLLRGNRAQKVHNAAFVAFSSGKLPPLARVGVKIAINEHLLLPAGSGPTPAALTKDPEVAAIRIFPGMHPAMLRALDDAGIEGVVLETYGAGTFPARDQELLGAVRRLVDRGAVVVNCSQCHGGAVHQTRYGSGAALDHVGVVSGRDMTPEAALTKLYWLLGRGLSAADVREQLAQPVAGEISEQVAESAVVDATRAESR